VALITITVMTMSRREITVILTTILVESANTGATAFAHRAQEVREVSLVREAPEAVPAPWAQEVLWAPPGRKAREARWDAQDQED
jgi:hypothetical protein